MITRSEWPDVALSKVPEFQEKWKSHTDYWGGENAGLCNDLAAFSHFTVDKVLSRDEGVLVRVFSLTEHLMVHGDEEIRTAVATCFLENLINQASDGVISSVSFVHLLGEASRAHCKKWDEFTGSKTLGLE